MGTRVEHLARPKPNLLRHPDRRSVYWLDRMTPGRVTTSTTTIELSPRWSQLCRNKKSFSPVELIRESPVWKVTEQALNAVASARVCSLARPQPPAAGWQPDRPLPAPPGRAVRGGAVTPRTLKLAQPKRRFDVEKDSAQELRTPPASSCSSSRATPRIFLLAAPKSLHPEYAGERSLSWPGRRSLPHAAASSRVLALSRPKERRAGFQGFDPYAISPAALSAAPTPRLGELCLPLAHKCKTK